MFFIPEAEFAITLHAYSALDPLFSAHIGPHKIMSTFLFKCSSAHLAKYYS